MQNETHYTSKDRKTRTQTVTVHRKSDNKQVGRIFPTTFGYCASYAGQRTHFSTKQAAFNHLAK